MKSYATLALLVALAAYVQAVEINIEGLGSVEGTTSSSTWSKRRIYEYRGIPYAEQPIGNLRFKETTLVAPWNGTGEVKDATKFGPHCPQPDMDMMKGFGGFLQPDAGTRDQFRTGRETFDESCLTLDIHTPTSNATAMLPVVVFFHGGSFMTGGSSSLRPGYLLEQDVILVTPQYRLGPLGYFYLNTPDAPGNMGLKDQRLALEWVGKYITNFGGDPSKVTVAGSSAGGASASLQMLSSLNDEKNRLFRSVLALSGSALALWAVEVEHGEQYSRDMAKHAGCEDEDAAALMICLRAKTTDELNAALVAYHIEQRKMGMLGMGSSIPVVQKELNGVVPFLSMSPQELLENDTALTYDPMPVMTGATMHEGISILDAMYQGYLVPNDLVEDTQFMKTEIVPAILKTYGVDENSRVMADACVRRYFNRDDMGDFTKMTPGLVDFSGVTFLKGSVFRQAELHSLNAKTFLFSFDYYGEHTIFDKTDNSVDIEGGITHGDDSIYMFPNSDYPLNENDRKISDRLVHLLVNFITYGHPTPEGHQVSGVPEFISYHREQGVYMSIDAVSSVKSNYRKSFTTARDNGILGHSAANANLVSPLLLLAAAAAVYLRL